MRTLLALLILLAPLQAYAASIDAVLGVGNGRAETSALVNGPGRTVIAIERIGF